MVTATVDDHVVLRRHMAIDALTARLPCGMKMMLRVVVTACLQAGECRVRRRAVAAHTERVTLGYQFPAMHRMAIRAHHALLVHAALAEGTVLEYFTHLLAVCVI
ncbi:MAG: hypothetical protein A2051_06610 [Desulfovibrionales bacterium GWA2_65_9]|nr:MAG: hypothetical protein A2051_06610 [Desulfovibrionales bacterium GWA2_65_9]